MPTKAQLQAELDADGEADRTGARPARGVGRHGVTAMKKRYDLALLDAGYSPAQVRQLTQHLIDFARRPSINPMGQATGGAALGFDENALLELEAAIADLPLTTDGDDEQCFYVLSTGDGAVQCERSGGHTGVHLHQTERGTTYTWRHL